jgi:hypothetical protein
MRGLFRFLILLIVVLAIAYLGAWWYVQGRMAEAFRAQEQILRQAGWTVSHGATTRGTSPLAATFSVADLAVTPPATGMATPRITLPNIMMRARITAPFTLDVVLPLAWQIEMSQGPAFTLKFATISDHYNFDPNALFNHAPDPLRQADWNFTGMRMDSANTNFTLISVASFAGLLTRNPHADKNSTALTVHETLTGLALSPIFVTLGHLPFDGKLGALGIDAVLSGPQLAPVDAGTMPGDELAAWQTIGPVIHDWAQAGGHGSFDLMVELGPLNAKTHGNFGFDSSVQPDGKATLVADGVGAFLGDIATAYPAAVGMISVLTAQTAPYMSKGAANAQRLTVDFGLAGGVLTANGKNAATVPPVVWPIATAKAAP